MNFKQKLYESSKGERIHLKNVKRKYRKKRIRYSIFKFKYLTDRTGAGRKKLKRKFIGYKPFAKVIPTYNEVIKFLIPRYKKFSNIRVPSNENGTLEVPEVFSISENYEKSMFFLKRLFHILYKQSFKEIFIDYKNCKYLDVDASACMDLILQGFIKYYEQCIYNKINLGVDRIIPINWSNNDIQNILFSIGAYKNLTQTKAKIVPDDSNFIPFNLQIGDNLNNEEGRAKEVHETEIVDYVINCIKATGRELDFQSATNLSKVVGEVMANAEEHSNFRFRYAIGYFVKPKQINNDLGVFKLCIFNFGQTIYESFSKPEKQDLNVVKDMKELSRKFTERGWLGLGKKSKFKEETLWTLYSLQEGVTSLKDWQRGKGTIRFIDRFFKLKGDDLYDDKSKLTLISGSTQIIFDGKYPLKDVINNKDGKEYKMMTFNKDNKIDELPDEKYVTFVPPTFPGTLITAKISLTNK